MSAFVAAQPQHSPDAGDPAGASGALVDVGRDHGDDTTVGHHRHESLRKEGWLVRPNALSCADYGLGGFPGACRIRADLRDVDERYLVMIRYEQRKAVAVIDFVAEHLIRLLQMFEERHAPDRRSFTTGDLLQVSSVGCEVFGPAARGRGRIFIEQVACGRVHHGPGAA